MDDNSRIRTAQQRVVEVFRRKPTAALSTMRARGHLDAGLLCTVRQDRHDAAMDMGAVLGAAMRRHHRVSTSGPDSSAASRSVSR
jgi:hypothetical protein